MPDTTIHIHQWGSPDRPALLFLHGFLGEGRDWRRFADTFATDFRCLAPDLPGHGNTPYPPLPATDAIAPATTALLAALPPGPLAVVGYSMGGRFAIELLRQAPERLTALLLESASPGLDDPAERRQRLAADAALAESLLRDGLHAFLERWYRLPLFASLRARPDLLRELIDQRVLGNPDGLAKALAGFSVGQQPPAWPLLEEPPCPTLYLAGTRDPKYAAVAMSVAERCPGVRAEAIPEAGHNIHLEQPAAFADRLARFLRSAHR